MLEIALIKLEPRKWTMRERTVILKRVPVCLVFASGTTLFGRMLIGYRADPLDNGKWRVTMQWSQPGAHVQRILEPSPEGGAKLVTHRVYPRMGVLIALRMLWLLLWSKRARPDLYVGGCDEEETNG